MADVDITDGTLTDATSIDKTADRIPITQSGALKETSPIVLFSGASLPAGFMLNGKLSVSVSGNDLIVALKTLADTDPSASDPIRVRIGSAEHTLTSALSVTVADGANTFNAGGAELATQEVGLFVYLRYNATTDAVTIGPSRIPYGRVYSDFSATATNEKYCAWNSITSATADDECENIGYFHAILSAGAGYTWTLPATEVTINKPTFETLPLVWTPQYSASGSLTFTSVTETVMEYTIVGRKCFIMTDSGGTLGGTASNSLYATLPFDASNAGVGNALSGFVGDPVVVTGFCWVDVSTSPDRIGARKYDSANYATGVSGYIRTSGFYSIG